MRFEVSVNYEALQNLLLRAALRLRDPLQLLQRWIDVYRLRRGLAWEKMTYQDGWPGGHVYMDTVLWPSPAPLDAGTTNATWGGMAFKKGEGVRKGRLRPSGIFAHGTLSRRVRELELEQTFAGTDNIKKITAIQKKLGNDSALDRYRVKPESIMMVDTGRMRGEFLGRPVISADHKMARLSTTVSYAAEQNERRPFAFIAQIDVDEMDTQAIAWVTTDVFADAAA